MAATRPKHTSIDEYIAPFPPDVQAILEKIRLTIREAAPNAQETISYNIPAFTLSGILVYFAAFKKHVGFYPPVSGDPKLQKAIAPYAGPKNNLQFPLDQPIPYDLIERIVKLRVNRICRKLRQRGRSHGECYPLRSKRWNSRSFDDIQIACTRVRNPPWLSAVTRTPEPAPIARHPRK